MRNRRVLAVLAFLLLLFPLSARAELTMADIPLIFASTSLCAHETELEVIATPKGAFEVVWVDVEDFEVKGLRFGRNLQPAGAPETLLVIHDSVLVFSDVMGAWTGRYEVALNAMDFGNDPDDPETGYRASLNLAGDPLAPAARFKPPRLFRIAPAAGGDSLQFRSEPPVFGPPTCRGLGLLVRRIDGGGAPVSAESRVTRRATAWNGAELAVDRLPNDTFVVAYSTCNGLVARRLNASGAPVGNAVNLPFPGRVGTFASGNVVLAASSGNDFAVVVTVSDRSSPSIDSVYTRGW